MKIGLLHLSDIHLKTEKDIVLTRLEYIAKAASSEMQGLDAIFLVITGDLVFSGSSIQYELAKNLTEQISEHIAKRVSMPIKAVIVPGNHDCDFSDKEEGGVRSLVLSNLKKVESKLDKNQKALQICLKPQENFFAEVSHFKNVVEMPDKPTLFFKASATVSDNNIIFNCYNTSWCSEIKEDQGSLFFPMDECPDVDSTLTISLFHHPLNWLESENALVFRKHLEETSDIILSGHEHFGTFYTKQGFSEEYIQYSEGEVLQESSKPNKSGFKLIKIDTGTEKQEIIQFIWKDKLYRQSKRTDRMFERNKFKQRYTFLNTKEFELSLEDIGIEFHHPLKKDVKLSDLFVYPKLTITRWKDILEGRTKKTLEVSGKEVFEEIKNNKYLLVYGATLSGKSILSKRLYRNFRHDGIIPLLINGSQITSREYSDLEDIVKKSFNEQYNEGLWDDFRQLDKKEKVLIIDDFHHTLLNNAGKVELLKYAKENFGYVLVFADDIYQIQHYSQKGQGAVGVLEFNKAFISEFGNELRGNLIEKWVRLGRKYVSEEKEILIEESKKENEVMTALSQGLLPSHPQQILMILEILDSGQTIGSGSTGSYGYLYEELITNSLREISERPADIDQKYTLLGYLAYRIFEKDSEIFELTIDEIKEIVTKYEKNYKLNVYTKNLVDSLVESRIFVKLTNERYRFAQPYIYYYFIARYIKDALSDKRDEKTLETLVIEMVECITYEPYFYILMFLVYLTKSRKFIELLVTQAKQIYSDFEPANLDKDVEFLNQLVKENRPIEVSSSIPAARKKLRKQRDINEKVNGKDSLFIHDRKDVVKYNKELNEISKIAIALKTLQLLGQILRNFTGSLRADLKLLIAEECYFLGLRVLKNLLENSDENIESIRFLYSELLKERKDIEDEKQLAKETDELLIYLHESVCFGMIHKISDSIGHEDLKAIYNDVLSKNKKTTAMSLINTAVHIDNFPYPNFESVIKLGGEIYKNKIPYSVLRLLVSQHLSKFPVENSEMQKLCTSFELSYQDQNKQILNEHKKRKNWLKPRKKPRHKKGKDKN